jgi:hypothetical protein
VSKYCVFLFFIVNSFRISAQAVNTSLSASYTSLCAYSAIHADAFSYAGNQAALMGVKKFCVGISGERRFLLQDLASYRAGFVFPAGSGNFGLQLTYFGNPDYHQSAAGLAYARRMGKVDVGVQFNYQQTGIRGYGSSPSFTVEAGTIFQLTEKLRTGVHIYNPFSIKPGEKETGSLSVYTAGFGYDASQNLFLGIGLEKTENMPVNVNAGFHFLFSEKIFVRAGISSASQVFFAGVGFWMNNMRIDAAAALHPYLGLTPGIVVLYRKHEMP